MNKKYTFPIHILISSRRIAFIMLNLLLVFIVNCDVVDTWKVRHLPFVSINYIPNPEGVVILSDTSLSITQFGITWEVTLMGAGVNINQDYGVFANGDFWVRGPIQITSINPPCGTIGGIVVNGAMIDPDPADYPEDVNRHQGYGQTVSDYDSAYNDALPNGQPVSQLNPINVNTGSCIVSTISTPGAGYGTRPNEGESYNDHLRTAAILTVLDSIPPANSFRPGYCSYPKVVEFNEADLNYSLLQQFSIDSAILNAMLNDYDIRSKGIPSTALDALNNVAKFFERPWIDHIPLAMGRSHHPIDNMPVYGRNISTYMGIGATMLHMDFSNAQKRDLLVRFVQLGIDLYSVATRQGGNDRWSGSGGQSSGRKWPILFAGIVLNDTGGMRNVGQVSGDYAQTNGVFAVNLPDDYIHFGEDDQTFYVTQAEIDEHAPYSHDPEDYTPPSEGNTTDPAYNPPPQYADLQGPQRFYPYRQLDLNLPEYGAAHWSYAAGAMRVDSKYWSAAYRHVNTPAWSGFILAAHATGAKTLWNHNALFDYVDRFIEIEPIEKHSSPFIQAVWNANRATLGPVWTGN